MAKVSIVLPTYNGERYIQESIDSILSQTFQDWELIIVDDCSVDNTSNIIQKYVKSDHRIKVIHNQTNQKLPRSLNIGFQNASGEYLTWISDDNYYYMSAIEEMNSFLDCNEDCPMVIGGMETIDEYGNKKGKWAPYSNESILVCDCVGACFMYRKSVLRDVGEYDTDLFLVEDYDYWLRILFHYGNIKYIDKILYCYRWSSGSLTATKMEQIRKQLGRLRIKHWDRLTHLMKKKSLCQIYYECKEWDEKNRVTDMIYSMIPEIREEKPFDGKKDIILYGAGQYGEKAYRYLNGKISFYADGNENITGHFKNGKKILSLEDVKRIKSKNVQIMITVGNEKIYDIIKRFNLNGIDDWCVYQSLKHTKEYIG